MVSFHSTRKSTDYLARAKPYPLEQKIGSRKCNRSRWKCVILLKVQIYFSNSVTGETYNKINNYSNSDSKCLVYFITCQTCTLQYTTIRPATRFRSVEIFAGAVLEKQKEVKNPNKNI